MELATAVRSHTFKIKIKKIGFSKNLFQNHFVENSSSKMTVYINMRMKIWPRPISRMKSFIGRLKRHSVRPTCLLPWKCKNIEVDWLLAKHGYLRKEMFYLTTYSTHFIYGYMASDIWLRTILIVRKEIRCRHMGYSFRLAARVILYAPSHRQDITYHGLCYTSRGALAGTK